ncbi:MAG: hypothetical protein GY838_01580 [bacterium]|nr:hypothetical protein [bacterium]
MSQQKNNKGLLKDGTSRLAKTGNRRGVPPILWIAVVVCAVGAFLLFRQPGGGDAPTGIGERSSVVTVGADSTDSPGHVAPRSGEVDIADETHELVAETPAGDAPPPETPVRDEQTAPPPARDETAAAESPPEEKIAPADRGGWVVQVGSFGSAENADREAARLREAGWDARVKVGNTSDGSMIYRVRIGYFTTRDLAQTFARQNTDRIPGAIAVHR